MTAIRIWMGPEREGYAKGIMTMFYESDYIDCVNVVAWLKKYPECKRIYLGAGRVRPIYITNKQDLELYASHNGVEVVIELLISNDALISVLPKTWTIIGVCLFKPTYLKTDDYKTVNIYKLDNPEPTDLSDLENGLFSCDTIIKE